MSQTSPCLSGNWYYYYLIEEGEEEQPMARSKNLECLFFYVLDLYTIFQLYNNFIYLKTHLLHVFQAQRAGPALSNSLRFRGGTHILLLDTKPALS